MYRSVRVGWRRGGHIRTVSRARKRRSDVVGVPGPVPPTRALRGWDGDPRNDVSTAEAGQVAVGTRRSEDPCSVRRSASGRSLRAFRARRRHRIRRMDPPARLTARAGFMVAVRPGAVVVVVVFDRRGRGVASLAFVTQVRQDADDGAEEREQDADHRGELDQMVTPRFAGSVHVGLRGLPRSRRASRNGHRRDRAGAKVASHRNVTVEARAGSTTVCAHQYRSAIRV
jgi:hypothetical protein